MSKPAAKSTISDIVIETVNRLRAGEVPADVAALLAEMRDSCRADAPVASVGGVMHRHAVRADLEQACAAVQARGAALPPLAKSVPLCAVAHDIAVHLNTNATHALDAATVLAIAGKHLVPRDDPVLAASVVYTSGTCLRICGDGNHAAAARHIVASLLIDDCSPQHTSRAKIRDPRFSFVCGPSFWSLLSLFGFFFFFFCILTTLRVLCAPASQIGAYSGQHKLYGNVTVLVYASTVTPRAPMPVPPRTPPPRPPVASTSAAPSAPSTPLGTTSSTGSGAAGTPERVCPVAKVALTADKTAAVMELCPCTAAELACTTLVRKGGRIVMRHGARERCWRVPFALTADAAMSARCRETALPDGSSSYTMLEVAIACGTAQTVERVADDVLVPASTAAGAGATPAFRLKTSTARGLEAYMAACRVDVRVAVSIVRLENAPAQLEFRFAFRQRKPDGTLKGMTGKQNMRLLFECRKDDVHVALHDAVLTVSIRPAVPPANPADPEYPIPIVV